MSSRQTELYLKLILVPMIWGGMFICGHIVAAEMPPATGALWRYVIASVALLLAHFWMLGRLPRLTFRQALGLLSMGATGVAAYNLCFMVGMQTVSASRAALIANLNPALTVLGAAILFGEKLTRPRIIGVALALAGAIVVISHGNPLSILRGQFSLADVIVFGCALSWTAYTLIGKRVLQGLSPLSTTTYAALAGTVILAIAALLMPAPLAAGVSPPTASLLGWSALLFLGVPGTAIAFVWYSQGVRELGPTQAAVFVNLTPVFAVLLAFLLLREALLWSVLTGGALVVAGVWFINRSTQHRSAI
jgi:drug/metabolite transporter (DMT)-like permease